MERRAARWILAGALALFLLGSTAILPVRRTLRGKEEILERRREELVERQSNVVLEALERDAAPPVDWETEPLIAGRVSATASRGRLVLLDVGASAGVRPRMTFQILRDEAPVAQASVIGAAPGWSVAKILPGDASPEAGDLVTNEPLAAPVAGPESIRQQLESLALFVSELIEETSGPPEAVRFLHDEVARLAAEKDADPARPILELLRDRLASMPNRGHILEELRYVRSALARAARTISAR
jgi:hypothetical protein